MTPPSDEDYMREALGLAAGAAAAGEVPVGALVVCGGRIVGRGANAPLSTCDPTAHAEILALRAAGATLASYRLADCTLYVTLEPCPMCAAAIVHARLRRVVFGTWDPRQGAVDSAVQLLQSPSLNHRVDAFGGVLGAECKAQLTEFFRDRRA